MLMLNFNHLLSLLYSGASPDAAGACRYSPLHWACYSGYTDEAALLLSYGADVNVRDTKVCCVKLIVLSLLMLVFRLWTGIDSWWLTNTVAMGGDTWSIELCSIGVDRWCQCWCCKFIFIEIIQFSYWKF